MTTDLSVGDLIQRLHALNSARLPSSSSPATSPRTSPSKLSSVSAFHIHPTFSPRLLSTVTARAGLPSLPPPPAPAQPLSKPVRHQQSDRFIQALLARHEQSNTTSPPKTPAAATATTQSSDVATPATPAAAAGTAAASPVPSPSALSSPSSISAAAGRLLLNSLIVRYTGTALPLKRSPARSVGRKSQIANLTATEPRPLPSERASPAPPPPVPSFSTPQPPPPASSSSTTASSRHHRQLFTRSSSTITPASSSSSVSSSPPSSSSTASTVSSRPKRSASTAGSTARQRASVEVEKAQLKAAAEAARNAARATEMAASLLIHATTGGRLQEEETQQGALPTSTAEVDKVGKRERLSNATQTSHPGADELLRLSSAGEQQSLSKQSHSDGQQQQQQSKRRRTASPGQRNGKAASRVVQLGRKRKQHNDDNSVQYRKRQTIHPSVTAASSKHSKREADECRDGDTSGDSADDTDGSGGRSYYSDSSVDSDHNLSHSIPPLPLPVSKADTLLAATRSASFATRLSSPLLTISGIAAPGMAVVGSASFGEPVLSGGPAPLARTSSRGSRLRASPLLN